MKTTHVMAALPLAASIAGCAGTPSRCGFGLAGPCTRIAEHSKDDDGLPFAGTHDVGMAETSGPPTPDDAEVQDRVDQTVVDHGVAAMAGEYGACLKRTHPDMTRGRRMREVSRFALAVGACVGLGLGVAPGAMAQADRPPAPSVRASADAMAADLVHRMTLDEKIGQLLNVAPAIPRLKVPAYNWWTESLHGAIGPVPTTNFPEPIGLAASFDAPLVRQVASAISVEVRALHRMGRESGGGGGGLDTWSPNINIFRDPRWGRGQETYGEDPYLTASLGVAFITGMQGSDPDLPDVIATPKHFAVHSGPESTRHVANVDVSPHDLEDTYLPAFRAAIVDARAGSVMCAYNRVDGQPACASGPLLKERLRGAWKFQGYVVSDCDALKDIYQGHRYTSDPAAGVALALKAGVDNECSTSAWSEAPALGNRFKEALARGFIVEADIDRALVRLFSARLRTGDLPGLARAHESPVSAADIGTPAHQALALRSAIESLVLLKNDGVLPLAPDTRIALIGPHADALRVLRGNYSSELSAAPVSVLDGLRQAMPRADVRLVPFTPSATDGDAVPDSAFVTPDGKPGLRAEYYNAAGPGIYETRAAASRVTPRLVSLPEGLRNIAGRHKVIWTGFLVAPESGRYRLALKGVKGLVATGGQGVGADAYSQWGEPLKFTEATLEKGHRYAIRVEAENNAPVGPGLFWKRVATDLDAELKAAVGRADVVVAAVGLTSDLEGEEMPLKIDGFSGGDRTTLDLPADQRRLLESAAALGKPLVVVLMNGSAINLGWARAHASAILEAWYPGQSGGRAIGEVLAGREDPGGRLPLTFYEGVADLPPFDDYAMKGRTYRYYAGTPVYPFGYGLSYTRFAYDALSVAPTRGVPELGLRVTATVRNTGARRGDEVAQLYITPPAFPGAPRLALRGVQRVRLEPGQSTQVTFDLSPRDLSFVNAAGERRLLPGRYALSVGGGQPGADAATLSASYAITTDTILPE